MAQVQRQFCDIVGYEREELSAMSVFQLIFPDGFERLRQGRQDTGGGVQELYQGEAHRRQGREARLDQPDRLPGARRRGRATLLYRGRRGYRRKRKQAEEEPQRTQERLRQSEGRFKVLAQEEYEAQRTIGKLTPREKQVLRALGEGLDSKDIAEKLHLIVETERTHMVNILNKLDVHSRLQALVFAVRHGLVEMH